MALVFRPEEIPLDSLHYEITPRLVSHLTWAHYEAGAVSRRRFSHYGYKRLETDAQKRRIGYGVMRAGKYDVEFEEVARVLAGDILPRRKQQMAATIRRVAVLADAVQHFGEKKEKSTPELFHTYLDFLARGETLWHRFVGQPKHRLLDAHRASVTVSDQTACLYNWINNDELVSDDPFLRAATLYWGLSIPYSHPYELPAVDAIVEHELRAGFIDSHGLLVFGDSEFGESCQHLGGRTTGAADHEGRLTSFFEHYTFEIARALTHLDTRLGDYQDQEDRLPWLMVRPPDELDRQIFEVIEKFGKARSQDILAALTDPPPLRTLQRRLQRLAKEGLVAKYGSRKFAYYRLAEHF
jgi:hypothetical protein